MTREMVERARRKAMKSACQYKVSAIGLNKRGEILCACFNASRFTRHGGSKHAEMQVMLRAGAALRTIILCRVGKSGKLCRIDPCPVCKTKADELGVSIISIPESR